GIALLQKNGFDLGGEHVHTLDDEHIIATAHRLAHLYESAAAGTLFTGENADIPGPVAQEREGLLGNGGKYQFALAAFRQDLAGVRVDDLSNEVVLIDVHTGLFAAFKGHARTAGFRKTVDIIGLDA